MQFLVFFLAVVAIGTLVNGHGRLMEPPQRSSIWRDPRFQHLNLPANYDDGGLWCGGVRQDYIPQECGVCGDPVSASVPRPNEAGGIYANGVIAGNYTAGQVINISFELTAKHDGYFQIQICSDASMESESCFPVYDPLLLGNGLDKFDVTGLGPQFVNTTAKLPEGISCEHCILRVYYRAAKDWAPCDGICECEGGIGAIGCGLQEIVLNCADIHIK